MPKPSPCTRVLVAAVAVAVAALLAPSAARAAPASFDDGPLVLRAPFLVSDDASPVVLGPTLALAADEPKDDKADKKDAKPSKTDAPKDAKKGESKTGGGGGGGGGGGQSYPSAGSHSTPQGKNFGLGLQLGYPTAITLKYMLKADQGIVAGLGGGSGFAYFTPAASLHVDYVWHPSLLTSTDLFALTWYVGGGGNIVLFAVAESPASVGGFAFTPFFFTRSNFWLAGRMPIGVNLAFQPQPFEVYLELVPSLLIYPAVSFGIGAALGGRFYF